MQNRTIPTLHAQTSPDPVQDSRAHREQLDAASQKIIAGIRELTASGAWREFWKFQGRFHRYSFANTLLIQLQKPDACRVAGYATWKRFGRHVRPGEQGIGIFVPLLVRARPEEGPDGPAASLPVLPRLVGFKIGHVFDVSQTEGQALPRTPAVSLAGEDAGLIAALDAFARQVLRIEIEERNDLSTPGANGECQYGADGRAARIRIRRDNSPRQRAKTRVHEIGHALLHSGGGVPEGNSRAVRELEAESVAYCVLEHFGLDSGDYSFGYLALWGRGEEAIPAILASGERIRRTCDRIITWIEAFYSRSPG